MNRFSFTLNTVQIVCLFIFGFTLLQGFYNSLYSEFALDSNLRTSTFLFYPDQVYGDLIMPTTEVPPFDKPQLKNWPPRFRPFYLDNIAVEVDLSTNAFLDALTPDKLIPDQTGMPRRNSCLNNTPATLLMYLLAKRMLIKTSLLGVIAPFYLAAMVGLGLVCFLLAGCNSPYKWLTAWLFLFFSYPFLTILCRGNIGALFTGLSLILYVYEICRGKRFFLACFLLVIACNFRPNALLLAPLLLCLNRKWLVLGLGGAGVVAGLAGCLALTFWIDGRLYPGYSIKVFLGGLRIFFGGYVLGGAGDQYNNSAFGCLKLIVYFLSGEYKPWHYPFFGWASNFILLLFSGIIAIAGGLFYFGKLTKLELGWITVTSYTLGTPVFGVYHLFVFFAFLFVLSREVNERIFQRTDLIILAATAFVLIPKNYIYFNYFNPLSAEIALNPIVMTLGVLAILWEAWKRLSFNIQVGNNPYCSY